MINYVLEHEKYFRDYVVRLHQRRPIIARGLPATPRTWTGCSPASTPSSGSTTRRTLAVRGHRGAGRVRRAGRRYVRRARPRTRAAGRGRGSSRRRSRAAAHGSAQRRRTRNATRRSSTRGACSRCSSGTSPATHRRWSEQICGVPPDRLPPGLRAHHGELRPRPHHRVRLRGRLDAAHRGRAVHPRPLRSCSRCSATSAGPAAASWRCAGTPASRARPTSRRCSTCCPATSRCRTRTRTRPRQLRRRREGTDKGLLGEHAGLHGQPAQGLLGRRRDRRRTTSASTTCPG